MRDHNYFVYILTNIKRSVLYTGVTNDLSARLEEHKNGSKQTSFTSRYKCYYLVYFEHHQYIDQAIDREKEIKGWSRAKKDALISAENKDWKFLNDED
ncbi:GIY-YIG nuclease family protein [Pedobacter frigoris]|uniref:GIY-YIG nuclease family protein n=1 Tax=Pedobacter frigoris TaxID=2571272 RepID=UPI00292F9678|nr:GIY-YIG nuclease family protein [Pedobacter frigoris]